MVVKLAVTWKDKQRLKVFKNRMLKHIWAKGGGITGQWRKLHNEEFHDSHCSPNKIQVIKSRRMSWTGHVAYMWREEVPTGVWWGNLRERG